MPMLLYNADVDEAERLRSPYNEEEPVDEDGLSDACKTFFDLRQRTLIGMNENPAFRLVALGLLRKLRTNQRGTVLYGEVEDALGRYFRLLDADMQRFASLHEVLNETAEKQNRTESRPIVKDATAATVGLLQQGMREIAVVLLACGEMQRKALDLKMSAQRSIAESDELEPPLVSFGTFAEFIEEAMAVSDQLRRKHEELQRLRMKAMESVVGASTAEGAPAIAAKSGRKDANDVNQLMSSMAEDIQFRDQQEVSQLASPTGNAKGPLRDESDPMQATLVGKTS